MASKTPEEAMQDWENNTTQDRWERGLREPKQSVSEGLADFWGGSPGDYSETQSSYDSGVQTAIDRNAYADGTSGKGEVWMRRARNGVRD